MKLEPNQQAVVSRWVGEGLKLADIQKRIASEFNLSLTYMEVRFLVDDLKLVPKDPEPPKTPPADKLAAPDAPAHAAAPSPTPQATPLAPVPGGVTVDVDAVTRPGAIVSGKVTFSDGKTASWYLDQLGRLGVVPAEPGYKPPAEDLQSFQAALEQQLAKLGF